MAAHAKAEAKKVAYEKAIKRVAEATKETSLLGGNPSSKWSLQTVVSTIGTLKVRILFIRLVLNRLSIRFHPYLNCSRMAYTSLTPPL